ncbi:hypothetical protein HDV00_012332 [Rhizophlyctis rosea]|nr:hypothetical protein HDV00_012332 [Rhizophlyctis rosea]
MLSRGDAVETATALRIRTNNGGFLENGSFQALPQSAPGRPTSALQRSVTWADDKHGHGVVMDDAHEPTTTDFTDLAMSRSPSRDSSLSQSRSQSLSMSDRLANLAHEQSLLPAKAIQTAASHYDPSLTIRTSRSTTSTRPSTPTSAALAARASTGGRRSRPHSAQAREALYDPAAVRNARKRWATLRATHLPRLNRLILEATEEELLLLAKSLGLHHTAAGDSTAGPGGIFRAALLSVPYTLTIKHGFQYKYAMRHKHALLCVVHHPRIPMSSAEGRIPGNANDKTAPDDSQSENDANSGSARPLTTDAGGSISNTISIRKSPTYTFVTVDRTRQITIWDVMGGPAKVRASVKLQTDLSQFVYVKEFCMYAGVSFDKNIKFFNPKFDLTNVYCTFQPVQL